MGDVSSNLKRLVFGKYLVSQKVALLFKRILRYKNISHVFWDNWLLICGQKELFIFLTFNGYNTTAGVDKALVLQNSYVVLHTDRNIGGLLEAAHAL